LHGSVARGAASATSDVDLIAEFDATATAQSNGHRHELALVLNALTD
jgi:predicted nucleotidyltransferase